MKTNTFSYSPTPETRAIMAVKAPPLKRFPAMTGSCATMFEFVAKVLKSNLVTSEKRWL